MDQLMQLQDLLQERFGPEWPERLPALLRSLAAAGTLAEPKPGTRSRPRRRRYMTPPEVEDFMARRMADAEFLGRPAAYQLGFVEGVQLTLALLGHGDK